VDHIFATTESALNEIDRDGYANMLADARAGVDLAIWDAAWAGGYALSLSEAVAEAQR
jgi:hypothetical protein